MPPPMSSRSTEPSRLSMTPSLSETFDAAQHDDVRPLRVAGEPAEHLGLDLDQLTGRVRQPPGDVVDARVLAVHGPEAVADVDVRESGELVGEGAALARRPCSPRPRCSAGSPAARRRPSPSPATAACALSPTVSVANCTGRPRTSASRSATGARLYFLTACPFGRPRCAHTTTRAPRSASSAIVGALARIRPSSVMVEPSSGTLRSERTRTRFPRRSPRSSTVFTWWLRLRATSRRARRGRPGGWSIPTRCRTSRRP